MWADFIPARFIFMGTSGVTRGTSDAEGRPPLKGL
jgi:hypothetical protein